MNKIELTKVIENHRKWLNDEEGGFRADLRGAYLSNADLSGADLRTAVLSGANLSGANLSYAYLRNADLSYAYLSNADLSGADLRNADLSGTNLSGANLSGANLSGANLSGANLDFSCLPLKCGGLKWKIDKRIAAQLAYHFCSMECSNAEVVEAQNLILRLANQFHQVDGCGELKLKKAKESE